MSRIEVVDLEAREFPKLGETLASLPCPVTDEEWADQAAMSAELAGNIELLQAEMKVYTDETKARIKAMAAERRAASKIVRERTEDRPVAVRLLADPPENFDPVWELGSK